MTLGELLATPGIWLLAKDNLFFVEVDGDLTCHQLKPDTLERDGVLSAEGWSVDPGARVQAYGPFQRRDVVDTASGKQDQRDAQRYRTLRAQRWEASNLFVVAGGKAQVRLGVDCPNLKRLDEAVDRLRSQS